MLQNIKLFCLVVLLYCLDIANARGRMIDPPQRGSMWRAGKRFKIWLVSSFECELKINELGFNVPPNYNDMSDNTCGMIKQQWDVEKNCGVCGVIKIFFIEYKFKSIIIYLILRTLVIA
jgi:hypothetical protein